MFKKAGFLLTSLLMIGALSTGIAFGNQGNPFTDTKNHWAEDTISWAYENKIVDGYPDGTFKPNNQVTEAEFIKMMVMMYNPKNLSKEQGIHWADPFYIYSVEMNYPVLGTNNIQKRNAAINRQRVADLVVGTQGVNYVGDQAIQFLLGNGLAQGKSSERSIAGFDPTGLFMAG